MKRNFYNKNDAGLGFTGAIIMPQLVALVYIIILSFIANFTHQNYTTLLSENLVAVVFSAFISPIAFCSVFVIINKKRICWTKACGLKKKINVVSVLMCILMSFICVFGVNNFVSLFDYLISLTGFKGNYSLPLPLDNGWWLVLNIFLLAVLPAIFEELLFRGVIFNGLKDYGDMTAVFGSAALFALMHGGIEQLIYPFIVGIILGFVMKKTNNVFYTMIIHFFNNVIVIVYNFILIMLAKNLVTTVYDWKYILIAIALFIVAFALIYVIIRFAIKKDNEQIKLDDINIDENIIEIENNNETKSIIPNNNLIKFNKFLWFGIIVGIIFWISDLIYGFVA